MTNRRKPATDDAVVPADVIIASTKDDAQDYLDTHPHIDADNVVIADASTKSLPTGRTLSGRVRVTRAAVRQENRRKITDAARAAAASAPADADDSADDDE